MMSDDNTLKTSLIKMTIKLVDNINISSCRTKYGLLKLLMPLSNFKLEDISDNFMSNVVRPKKKMSVSGNGLKKLGRVGR